MQPPERPIIEQGSIDSEWPLFVDSCYQYKDMCGLTNPAEIQNELKNTCLTKVNRILFKLVEAETLNTITEHQLLHQIQLVTVKGVHKEVHQQTFHHMRQQKGERITHFLVKLQSQVKFCEFTIQCTNERCNQQVNYSEDIVAGQLMAGLANDEHKGKVITFS